jgi:hypothetical protein
LEYGQMGVYVVPCPKVQKSLMKHAYEMLEYFGVHCVLIIYVKANIGREGCSWRFNILLHDAWCMIGFMHHLMHPPHIYNFY